MKSVSSAKNKTSGEEIELKGDYCLVAVGRRPYTDSLNLENAGLSVDEKGRIPVNDHLQTAIPHIWPLAML